MPRSFHLPLAACLAVAAAGCGGSSAPAAPAGCTVVVTGDAASGVATQTLPCGSVQPYNAFRLDGVYEFDNGGSSLWVAAGPASSPISFWFAASAAGVPFPPNAETLVGAVTFQVDYPNRAYPGWQASYAPGQPQVGVFRIEITDRVPVPDRSPTCMLGDPTIYGTCAAVHGRLHVILAPVPPQKGTVTMDWTF